MTLAHDKKDLDILLSNNINKGLPSSSGIGTPPIPPPGVSKSPIGQAATKKYGIAEAIALMRRMPAGDMSIVAAVIKETLESTQINVQDIIKDAREKEMQLETQISSLNREIDQLQSEITRRGETIRSLTQDLEETRHVRSNLSLGASEPEPEPTPVSQESSEHQELPAEGGPETPKPESANDSGTEAPGKNLLLDAFFSESKNPPKT